jgi:hypothetical protein
MVNETIGYLPAFMPKERNRITVLITIVPVMKYRNTANPQATENAKTWSGAHRAGRVVFTHMTRQIDGISETPMTTASPA